MLFTPEELEELRRIDAEIEEDFHQTPEELKASRLRDKLAKFDRLDNRGKRSAESQRAYREANREKIAESKRVLLRNRRKSLGLTQRAYAKELGVHQSLISFWENGAVPINLFFIDSVFPELGDALRKEKVAASGANTDSDNKN